MKLKQSSPPKVEIIAHLGLVAAILKKIRLAERIDIRIPKGPSNNNALISHGQAVIALILNGLGFVERRLSFVEGFFENKPVDDLIGAGVTAEMLNDDALGRALDAIHQYGVTKLFSEIAFEIGIEFDLLGKFCHLDTSSLSVTGKYDEFESGHEVKITYGHSKDHRNDLKQLILSLTTTGTAAFPIWMEALSGNSSDGKSFHETIKTVERFQDELKKSQDFIWVADSAFYSLRKLMEHGNNIRWISRVKETILSAKNLVERDRDTLKWIKLENGYEASPQTSYYGGVTQRWLVVFSPQAYKREIITFEDNLVWEDDLIFSKVRKLRNKIFEHKVEAKNELADLRSKHKLFKFETKIKPCYKNKRGKTDSGRQKKQIAGYKVEIIHYKNTEKIQKKRNSKGRFILATNVLNHKEISNQGILNEYKKQSHVEKGFKFIKDKSFLVSDVYLKKSTRIESLMAVMCFSLMAYNIGEFWIREEFKTSDSEITGPDKRKTKRPSLKTVFRVMRDIVIVRSKIRNKFEKYTANLTDDHIKILQCIEGALEIYGHI